MNIERLFKISLVTTFFMNMAGAVTFVPQIRFLREFGGLPEAGNSFYPVILAIWIFFFGVLYLRLAFSKTPERFFVLVGALGKSSFAVLLAVLAFSRRTSGAGGSGGNTGFNHRRHFFRVVIPNTC